ncbi:MAG: hypothetical protein ABS54_07970 [Hyphomicrobium sp. SCN 65-11]|nr:MAG: hypothetical protein ABS54_07970 [Hyphomicrobium sp. SCN 65-11]
MLNEDRVRQLSADTVPGKSGMTMQAPQRERGLWSFLTWSFFLSQLAIGNAFASGAAQAGGGVDLNAPEGTSNPSNTANALGTPDFRAVSMSEPQSAGPPTATAQEMASAVNAGPKAGGAEQHDAAGEAGTAVHAAIAQGASGAESTQAVVEEASSDGLPPTDAPGVMPGSELPPAGELPPVLGGVLPPVLETVNDLIGGLGPTLDGLVVPVVETIDDLASVLGPTLDHVLAPVESLVDGVLGGLQPTLDPLVASVATLAEGLGELVEPVGSVAGEIMTLADPILDAVEPVLSPVMNAVDAAASILDPVVDVAAPVVNVIEPVTAPLLQSFASSVEPVLEILPPNIGSGGLLSGLFGGGGSDAVASSGSIEFSATAEAAGHDLFQAGTYTEFGIALQETPSGDDAGAGDLLGNVADTVGALLGDADDNGQGVPSLIGNLHHEIGLRGLGEGLI